MAQSEKQSELAKLLQRLRDPVQLRFAITLLLLAVGYVGIYMPLESRLQTTRRELENEQKRDKLATDVEYLRAQADRFESRLLDKSNSNEWVRHILGGVRQFPLRLVAMDTAKPQRVGPFGVAAFRIEVEGEYGDLNALLRWLETNERIFRVDSVKLAPARRAEDRLVLQMTLLGMTG